MACFLSTQVCKFERKKTRTFLCIDGHITCSNRSDNSNNIKMYIRMYVCMYVCMHLFICAYTHAYIHTPSVCVCVCDFSVMLRREELPEVINLFIFKTS